MVHVTAVKYVKDKIIWLSFDNGASGEVDLSDHLIGPVFEPLKDTEKFSAVSFNEEIETVVWPNGADFAPEFLHDLLRNQAKGKRTA